jgi:ABC-type dipeptide/oligopeptide/nickel transport system permease component
MRTIARRLAFYVVTAIVAISVDFLIPRIIPGNPVDAIVVGHGVDEQQAKSWVAEDDLGQQRP